ncbi:hypothetical protein [Streptomyces sp. Isolate_45]|uniref:hypothetical protein n=1 Tax=Streptomyces sp. Isolate_45 TaxID=2950111 RepID=UPI002481DBCF|nr:hypothetical protein [Streptomyces sp. Isolate_45]MDA5282538.1 hypothetical protein [Streptomyces sp. Isolate_45]
MVNKSKAGSSTRRHGTAAAGSKARPRLGLAAGARDAEPSSATRAAAWLSRAGGSLFRPGARSLAGQLLSHLKVAFAFLIWISLVREQASLIVDWRLYYSQALVATCAVAVMSVMVVYLHPPRTERWRTVVWAFLASSVGGALAYAALGGRAGLLGTLLCGALVLWARGEERGRRAYRRLRMRRRAS